ncbi:hypothetical protein PHYPSEUDO_009628 [Phytophthora pseudosyringae]|uniref:Uncharacterized protein n=1 Tax=Phytophthora pseudosyringae TaxID=221518 RepID=A0A8T1WLV0_9STRA|nr:hypothetical protein PHYPSEUDO_009628 [Phytophthora pseudosyringae]
MGGEDTADASLMFRSRLRAKKEERMQQRQQEQELPPRSAGSHRTVETNTKAATRSGPESSSPGKDASVSGRGHSHQPIVAEFGEAASKRRERAEARKRVIDYHGSVWDAVSSNDLEMVRNYFLVEGAPTLLRRRHPDAEQGGRTLLHCAAWHGYRAIVELVLTTGCDVDVVDSVASQTTALAEAARAGHADVCVTLLRHGASPRYRDSYGQLLQGDTPFHWAGRQGHGAVLLQMALEQERLEPGSTPALWVTKNYKGRSVIDLVQTNAFIVPLLQKRLGGSFTRALGSAQGKRRSRFPVRAAVMGTRKSTLIRSNSRPGQGLNDSDAVQGLEPLEPAVATLSGVDKLGLDVSSFTYRSRGASTG